MKGLFFLLLLFQAQAYAEADLDEDFESSSPLIDILPSQYDIQNQNRVDDLIKIEPHTYKTEPKASYCIRNTDMIDTITIHHSEGFSTDTADAINRYHLTRGSATDPWYMIGYSYVINTPYAGASKPQTTVTVGRPIQYVGAHAGSNIFLPMDEVQQKLWDSKKEVLCGKTNQWVYDPTLLQNGKIKANVTTIGVVIVGNYTEFSGKYKIDPKTGKVLLDKKKKKILNPYPNLNGSIPAQQPTEVLIDTVARLSCQLQRQYPRIKNFTYHRQYHTTSCPGTLKDHMNKFKAKAKEYGCEFKVIPGLYY